MRGTEERECSVTLTYYLSVFVIVIVIVYVSGLGDVWVLDLNKQFTSGSPAGYNTRINTGYLVIFHACKRFLFPRSFQQALARRSGA